MPIQILSFSAECASRLFALPIFVAIDAAFASDPRQSFYCIQA
jgi:hypothetical protein